MDLLDSDAVTIQDTVHEKCHEDESESQTLAHPKTSPDQNHIHGPAVPSEGDGGLPAKTETLCPPRPRGKREGEESEREETESSDDNTTQYSIHPPQDCPYLLLLQGCSLAQVSHSRHTPSTVKTMLEMICFFHKTLTVQACAHEIF